MSLNEIREILREESSLDIEVRLRMVQLEILVGTGLTPELFDDRIDYEEEMRRIEALRRLTRYFQEILVERLQQEAWDRATDLKLTPELIALIEGAGYEVCEYEGEVCDGCGGSCVRVWWVSGGYEYPMEGSYYCDKCALTRVVADIRRAAFGQKYCDSCHKVRRRCWCLDSEQDACIEEHRFRCPEDRFLTDMRERIP